MQKDLATILPVFSMYSLNCKGKSKLLLTDNKKARQ